MFDAGGMFPEVQPNGARYWRLKYRYAGKQKSLALGVYPGVRVKRHEKSERRRRKNLQSASTPAKRARRRIERSLLMLKIRSRQVRANGTRNSRASFPSRMRPVISDVLKYTRPAHRQTSDHGTRRPANTRRATAY
ncbi:Arm DNA-binding domain-containing protein [Caballeronia sp. SEWSISQ10-4 2]|uniref:Arm DNA-binding domain-containing protein n=1 Tax=Caballeronia sp. SEWSISQ10-4 2 TaxID=2937438 RepID=UPI00346338AC